MPVTVKVILILLGTQSYVILIKSVNCNKSIY
nr:unnamed protein product [Callosobruchus analis]